MYEKILLATDGSDDAINAMHRAIEIQKETNTYVLAFHSVEYHLIPQRIPLFFPFTASSHYTIPQPVYEEMRQNAREYGERVLADLKLSFEKRGAVVETRLVETEEPANYAIHTANEENFDLILLGCRGHHSKLRRTFLGTVATKVLNEANCDILVVR